MLLTHLGHQTLSDSSMNEGNWTLSPCSNTFLLYYSFNVFLEDCFFSLPRSSKKLSDHLVLPPPSLYALHPKHCIAPFICAHNREYFTWMVQFYGSFDSVIHRWRRIPVDRVGNHGGLRVQFLLYLKDLPFPEYFGRNVKEVVLHFMSVWNYFTFKFPETSFWPELPAV